MGIFSCVFVIIGAIIGAGFASGREIYSFFYVYGIYGALGILVALGLIGAIVYKSMLVISKYDIDSYDNFLKFLIPEKENRKINFHNVLNYIINIFLLITFYVMCAGFTAYFKQEFGINEIFSGIFIAIFSYIILNKSMKGIFLLNSILIPLIIIILSILGIKSVSSIGEFEQSANTFMWLPMAFIYASYNTITLASILIPMKKYIEHKKDIAKIAFFSFLIIFILAIVILLLLLNIDTDISVIELPAVYASGLFGSAYKYLYGVIIVAAIITTAMSEAFAFLNNVSKDEKSYRKINAIMCGGAVFASRIGFSNLVNAVYPVFGVLGLVQMGLILKKR